VPAVEADWCCTSTRRVKLIVGGNARPPLPVRNVKPCYWYKVSIVVRIAKSGRIVWAWRIPGVVIARDAYRILVRKLLRKQSLEARKVNALRIKWPIRSRWITERTAFCRRVSRNTKRLHKRGLKDSVGWSDKLLVLTSAGLMTVFYCLTSLSVVQLRTPLGTEFILNNI
jgi:hypothetical protein